MSVKGERERRKNNWERLKKKKKSPRRNEHGVCVYCGGVGVCVREKGGKLTVQC